MTDEDVWLLDGLRRDVNREIRDEVTERGLKVEVIEWWTILGEGDDLTISDIRKRDFLDSDNVHLKTTIWLPECCALGCWRARERVEVEWTLRGRGEEWSEEATEDFCSKKTTLIYGFGFD